MAKNHECCYYLECEIRDKGEATCVEKRESDPKSQITAYICLSGEEAANSLANLLSGLLDSDPDSAEGKSAARSIKNDVTEDAKKEKPEGSAPRLVCQVSKKAYVKPSMTIKVYRMG